MNKDIKIKDEYITLGQLLKIANLVSSGGEEKLFLKQNEVLVNNEIEQRRGKKLYKNDVIKVKGNEYKIC